MTSLQVPPLGRLLVETGAVSKAALEEILVKQATDRRRLGELLVEGGHVRPHQLAQLVSHQLSCPWVSLPRMQLDPAIVQLIPRAIAVDNQVVPVHLREIKGPAGVQKVLYVALVDPTDEHALAECAKATGLVVKPMVAVTSEIRAVLAELYPAPPPRLESTDTARTLPPPPAPITDEEITVEDADVIAVVTRTPAELRRATILTLNAPETFLQQVRAAAMDTDGAEVLDGNLMRAVELVTQHKPCAIVVTDDVYSFDRMGLNRLALDNDTVLVVWNEDAEKGHLSPLLAGALKRWRHAAYEKGAVLDGRYELLRDLGGPLATSRWEVRHTRTSRRAILHVAAGNDDAAGVGRQQLALAKVSHPGAVDLLDAGTTDGGDPYIVLEQVEGKSLEGLVAARGKLTLPEACSIILQIGHILENAHAENVLHNDVCSENVIMVRDPWGVDRAKLVGWQDALVVDAELEPRGDVMALGRCAFEALSGRKPSPGDQLAADIPADLVAAVTSALGGSLSLGDLVTVLDTKAPRRERKVAPKEKAPTSCGAEQRRFPRAPYRTPVRIEVSGLGNVDGRTEDISARGLYIVARANVGLGTEVKVRFALPMDGKVVAESATVKWTREANSAEGAGLTAIGVELFAPAAETLRQVEKYVGLMSIVPR